MEGKREEKTVDKLKKRWGMEENGRKRSKMRKLPEGNAGRLKGMLDTESSRWKKSKEPKVNGEQRLLGFRPRQFARG